MATNCDTAISEIKGGLGRANGVDVLDFDVCPGRNGWNAVLSGYGELGTVDAKGRDLRCVSKWEIVFFPAWTGFETIFLSHVDSAFAGNAEGDFGSLELLRGDCEITGGIDGDVVSVAPEFGFKLKIGTEMVESVDGTKNFLITRGHHSKVGIVIIEFFSVWSTDINSDERAAFGFLLDDGIDI